MMGIKKERVKRVEWVLLLLGIILLVRVSLLAGRGDIHRPVGDEHDHGLDGNITKISWTGMSITISPVGMNITTFSAWGMQDNGPDRTEKDQ